MVNAVLLMPWSDEENDKGKYACRVYADEDITGDPICVVKYTEKKFGANAKGTPGLFLYRKDKQIASLIGIFDRKKYRLFSTDDGHTVKECIAVQCSCTSADDCDCDEDIRYTDDEVKEDDNN